MSELTIPIGIDPYGREVHITEARRGFGYYKCPKCSIVLEARRGPEREYFAHLRNTPDADNCPLRTDADVEVYLRLTPIDKRENAKRLWMFIVTNRLSDNLRLVAKFRTPAWEDFTDIQQVKQMIDSIRIQSEGTLRQPSPEMFHPNRVETTYELNPAAPRFRIDITSSPRLQCITGNWTGEAPKKGDLYVGDWETAEKVESMSSLEQGAIVYLVSDVPPRNAPPKSRIYRLGKLIAVGVELDAESTPWLASVFPDWQPGQGAFAVDVVLPPTANPRGYPVVVSPPGREVLVALIPPPDTHVTFEMVLIPDALRRTFMMPTVRAGSPKLEFITLPERGSLWASFFCNARQKMLRFQVSPEQQSQASRVSLAQAIPRLGLKSNGSTGEVMSPWKEDAIFEVPAALDPSEVLDLAVPDGLPVGLKGRIERNGLGQIVRTECPDAASAIDTVQTWAEEGCYEIEMSFATMGRIVLKLPPRPKVEVVKPTIPEISDEEIRTRLLGFKGGVPRRATWRVARTVLRIPSGTAHHDVTPGFKKKVRRALMRSRGEHAG